jgi:FKBP-type peptidyl-prolyl cis-trans isomerase SlyD
MSAAPRVVEDGAVVLFHYTLTVEGQVLDSSKDDGPMAVLTGQENIVAGLEKALIGKAAGDVFDVSVEAADGYGDLEGPGPQPLPRDAFPEDAEIEAGMAFSAGSEEEGYFTLWVTGTTADEVLVDKNHPLAGKQLDFHVEVKSVREASPEERAHGHVHGEGGHHH